MKEKENVRQKKIELATTAGCLFCRVECRINVCQRVYIRCVKPGQRCKISEKFVTETKNGLLSRKSDYKNCENWMYRSDDRTLLRAKLWTVLEEGYEVTSVNEINKKAFCIKAANYNFCFECSNPGFV